MLTARPQLLGGGKQCTAQPHQTGILQALQHVVARQRLAGQRRHGDGLIPTIRVNHHGGGCGARRSWHRPRLDGHDLA